MTIKEFKDMLDKYDEKWNIEFSGLTVMRFKKRDARMVNLEFNENILTARGACDKCGDWNVLLSIGYNDHICDSCRKLKI